MLESLGDGSGGDNAVFEGDWIAVRAVGCE